MSRPLQPLARLLGPAVAGLVVTLLRLTKRRTGLVLLYHSVAERQGDPARELVAPHGARLFERQLRHLVAWYRVVDATEIHAAVAARRRGGRFPVAVTFDDDLRSHARMALPILERAGLRATFFLCGASLHEPFEFWWERLDRIHPRAETWKRLSPAECRAAAESDTGPVPAGAGMPAEDVRRLVEAHMTIGFHTRRHDPLPGLDDGALAAAMLDGRDELETVAGSPLETIAYPHGAKDERVLSAARAAGFRYGFSAAGLPARPTDDPLAIPRILPTYRSAGHFALQLLRELLDG